MAQILIVEDEQAIADTAQARHFAKSFQMNQLCQFLERRVSEENR